MPRYLYKAIDSEGRTDSGEIEAASADDARTQLEAAGLRVDSVDRVAESKPTGDAAAGTDPVHLRERDVLEFGDSVSQLHTSNLPLESGLRALGEEIPSRRLRRALLAISERLERGETWGEIGATGVVGLTPAFAELLQAGLRPEQAAPVFEGFLHCSRRAQTVRSLIRRGLIYSCALMTVMTGMVLGFLVWIVPEFKNILDGFEIDSDHISTAMPAITYLVFSVSSILTRHWGAVLLILCGIAAGVGGIYIWLGPLRRHRLLCAVPIIGPAYRNAAISNFCHLFAMLLEQGVATRTALRIAGAGCGDPVIARGCREIEEKLEQGVSLQKAALAQREIPDDLLHLFEWVSRQDVFYSALHSSGDAYHGQARIRADLVPLIIEPIFIMTVTVVIGTLVFAIFLPMIKLMNALT